jgi:hypothetical protein
MATQIPTELESFHRFLTEQLKSGGTNLSPEESLEAFRAYQRDLERCREDVRPALQRSLRRESEPLDIEDIKARGRQRMQEKSITE